MFKRRISTKKPLVLSVSPLGLIKINGYRERRHETGRMERKREAMKVSAFPSGVPIFTTRIDEDYAQALESRIKPR